MSRSLKIFCFSILLIFISFYNVSAQDTFTWHDCIKEAAKNHPDLIAASEEIKQSVAEKDITASAIYPQLDGSLSVSTSRANASTTKDYSYGVTGSQLIFDGTKTIQDINAAREDISAAKQNFKFTSVTVRMRLRTAFVNLLKAQEMLKITREILSIRKGNYEIVTLKYVSGLEHKGALLTAEADLAQARYEVAQAQRNVEVTRRDLLKEMGRLKFEPIEVSGSFELKNSERAKPDFEALANNNPALQKLISQKNAAAFSLNSAYANFSPTLTGEAGAGKSAPRWPPKTGQWDAGLTLSMPIFEGGLRLAQVAQARGLLNQLKENERSARDGIILTLEQTWAGLQDAIDNSEVQRKSLLATQERSRISQAQYSTGFISFDNWIIIEDNFVKAKRSFLDAQANVLLAEANWVKAKGETLEYE